MVAEVISELSYFLPILSFLFVFIVIFALLDKTKVVSESKFLNIFLSGIVAVIFITFTSVRSYVENIVPWVAVLIVALFFVLFIVLAAGGKAGDYKKPVLWVFVILLILIFLFAAIKVFSATLGSLLPESLIYSSRFLGAVLLIILTAAVAWVMTR